MPERAPPQQAFHLLWNPSQGRFEAAAHVQQTDYTLQLRSPVRRADSALDCSQFTRRYYENPC